MEYDISSLKQLKEAADDILANNNKGGIFLLHGNLGAGKTTFVQFFCAGLGIQDAATSPTYALVNIYGDQEEVYHIDLYRLESVKEALDIGIEELIEQGIYSFIEWPEIVEEIIPKTAINLYFRIEENRRKLEVR